MPFSYLTGYFRLLNFKNFPKEIGIGLFMDFFLYVLPLLFIQAINNSTLFQQQYAETGLIVKLNTIQTIAMMTKLMMLVDVVLEVVMYVYEMIKLH